MSSITGEARLAPAAASIEYDFGECVEVWKQRSHVNTGPPGVRRAGTRPSLSAGRRLAHGQVQLGNLTNLYTRTRGHGHTGRGTASGRPPGCLLWTLSDVTRWSNDPSGVAVSLSYFYSRLHTSTLVL